MDVVNKYLVILLMGLFTLCWAGSSVAGNWKNPDLLVDAKTVKENANKKGFVICPRRCGRNDPSGPGPEFNRRAGRK